MAVQLFSDKLVTIWSEWETRVLVLLSLSLQIILILFGSRRKYIARRRIWMLVWSTYLLADWVATVLLGILARKSAEGLNPNNLLQALWAPFLLLHLGGPDTITAFSLEDNSLWLRHLLELVVQVGIALYVFLRCLSSNVLTFVATLIFISGIIKYGERSWALKSSSQKYFQAPLHAVCETIYRSVFRHAWRRPIDYLKNDDLVRKFVQLAAPISVSSTETLASINLADMSVENVFSIIKTEIGLMYEALYTKAIILSSPLGIFLRCFSFLSSISALIVFSITIDGHDYPSTDISITYMLLVGAVVSEIYASITHFFSDWAKLHFVYKGTCAYLVSSPFFTNRNKCSTSMGQLNLISYCLKDLSIDSIPGVGKLFGINKFRFFKKYIYLSREDVSFYLQELIFSEVKEKKNFYKGIFQIRGDYVLENRYERGDAFRWCTVEIEFVLSLLIWHIATDLCYSDDLEKRRGDNNLRCRISKQMSDYMLYLVIFCPSIFYKFTVEFKPRFNQDIELAKIVGNVIEALQSKKVTRSDNNAACKVLREKIARKLEMSSVALKALSDELEVSSVELQVLSDESEVSSAKLEVLSDELDVLSQGCKLANQMQLEFQDFEEKWKMISEVWIEMLGYAATQCEWTDHAQQLWKGGELLSHVALLIGHIIFG